MLRAKNYQNWHMFQVDIQKIKVALFYCDGVLLTSRQTPVDRQNARNVF